MNQDEDSKWRLDDSPEVTSRNRYSNIAAWEYNRVKLKVPSEYCDYINASPIALNSRKDGSMKRYICTQVRRSSKPQATNPQKLLAFLAAFDGVRRKRMHGMAADVCATTSCRARRKDNSIISGE